MKEVKNIHMYGCNTCMYVFLQPHDYTEEEQRGVVHG